MLHTVPDTYKNTGANIMNFNHFGFHGVTSITAEAPQLIDNDFYRTKIVIKNNSGGECHITCFTVGNDPIPVEYPIPEGDDKPDWLKRQAD